MIRKHSQDPLRSLRTVGCRSLMESLKAVCHLLKEKTERVKVDLLHACLPGILLTSSEELPRTSRWRMPSDCTWFHYSPAVARVMCRSYAFWVICTVCVSVVWELEKGSGARPPPRFLPRSLGLGHLKLPFL